jgi:signal-transduction protein with cAMP-binding, CBS, and nucleotidyltransferase domain
MAAFGSCSKLQQKSFKPYTFYRNYSNSYYFNRTKFVAKQTIHMRTAKDILQQKGAHFNSVKHNETVFNAIGLMRAENISYLIVKDDNDKYLGIFSERDYAHKVILENKQSGTTKVGEIMTTDLANASPEDSTSKLMLLINNSKARYIPVFDGNNFMGVITIHDLMREAMADYEKGKQDLEAHTVEFLKNHDR